MGSLRSVVSQNKGSDMRYGTIRRLIIFVYKEFGPAKVLVEKRPINDIKGRTTREAMAKIGCEHGPICTASHDPKGRSREAILGTELEDPK